MELGASLPSWASAVKRAEAVSLDESISHDQHRIIRKATCTLVDGSGRNAVGLARQVCAVDPALQIIIVTSAEERGRTGRAVLFAPGLGEVWFADPAEVGVSLLETADRVTRQRRSYRATQITIEHDLANIESQPILRAVISDAYLASLLGVLPDPVLSIDSAGHILSWNPAAQQVLGFSRSEAVGKLLGDLLAPDDPSTLATLVANVSETSVHVEARFRRRGGESGIGEIAIVPVEAGGQRVYAVVLHDVTEERQVQERLENQATELEVQAFDLASSQLEREAANSELQRSNEQLESSTLAAQRARRDAEGVSSRLEAVLQQMPSGVILAEAPSGRLILGNEQVERIWRSPFLAAATTGEYVRYPGYRPDGTPYLAEEWPLARSLRGERVMGEEIEILRGDSTRGVISVSSAPILDAAGKIVAAVTVFDDVTEKKENEMRLALLDEAGRVLGSTLDYLQTLQSIAQLAVPRFADWCAVDVLEGGRIQRLAVAHSDPAQEQLVNEVAWRWPIDPDSNHALARVLRTGEAEHVPVITDEMLQEAAHGAEHLRILRELGLRSAMIVPLMARDRTLGALTFITSSSLRVYGDHHLKFAEELASRAAFAADNARLFRAVQEAQERADEARMEAEAANRAKSQFLATMSHEIRTPINAIIGYTELLRLGLYGQMSDRQAEQLERIRASSRHLLRLIEDILDLAKVEAGRLEVARESAQASDAIAFALAMVAPQAAEKSIRIETVCDEDAEVLYVGDEDRVRQILVNLLANAVKFTESGGQVRITCGRTGDPGGAEESLEMMRTYVRVIDTGIGIQPAEIERIFRPFEQVDKGHTRIKGGTGLGLTISRQLALLMGGDLTVESEPGVGSVFTLWLPTKSGADTEVEDSMIAQIREERPRGLAAVGESIAMESRSIIDSYRERLRTELAIAKDPGASDVELEDHALTLLADIGHSLAAMEKSAELPEVMLRDGGDIQRVISDLHGRQRAQLGWSEAAIRRDIAILHEEVESAVRQGVLRTENVDGALALLSRFLERAERISVASLRRTMLDSAH
jgi:PAS domain S-box-containing protein